MSATPGSITTPRTDAAVYMDGQCESVEADVCRQLERELVTSENLRDRALRCQNDLRAQVNELETRNAASERGTLSEADELHKMLDEADVSRKSSNDAGKTWHDYSLAERLRILVGGYKLASKECDEAEERLAASNASSAREQREPPPGYRTGTRKLVYNKITKRIEVVDNESGFVVDSFEPPQEAM